MKEMKLNVIPIGAANQSATPDWVGWLSMICQQSLIEIHASLETSSAFSLNKLVHGFYE